MGVRRYTRCSLCNGQNCWEIENDEGKKNVILCSWCDVEKERRFSGVNFPWPV